MYQLQSINEHGGVPTCAWLTIDNYISISSAPTSNAMTAFQPRGCLKTPHSRAVGEGACRRPWRLTKPSEPILCRQPRESATQNVAGSLTMALNSELQPTFIQIQTFGLPPVSPKSIAPSCGRIRLPPNSASKSGVKSARSREDCMTRGALGNYWTSRLTASSRPLRAAPS